jgi:hypothetical protein
MINEETGEIKENKYHEIVILIIGIAHLATMAITKKKFWMMVKTEEVKAIIDLEGVEALGRKAACSSWNFENNCRTNQEVTQ